MASGSLDLELSPNNVVTSLQTLSVEKIRELVFHLGVPDHEIENVVASSSDYHFRKVRFVRMWLDCDINASWEKLIAGLERIGQAVLAVKIRSTTVSQQVQLPGVGAVTSGETVLNQVYSLMSSCTNREASYISHQVQMDGNFQAASIQYNTTSSTRGKICVYNMQYVYNNV